MRTPVSFFKAFIFCLLLAGMSGAAFAQGVPAADTLTAAVAEKPAVDTPVAEKPAADKPAADKAAPAASAAAKPDDKVAVADAVQAPAKQMEDMSIVVLRTIDKLSARTRTFDIPVDKTVKFGNSLFIKARACRKSSPLDRPENAAFLQIWERKPAEPKSHWLFSGWMFGSSPSLSRLDHPVYDVWVIECKNNATSKSEEFSSERTPVGSPDAQPLSGNTDDISFVAGAAPDKESERKPPEAAAPPKTDEPAAKPATDTPPVSKPASKPAEKPAKPTVPPLDKLPGSFDDGSGDDLPSGGD